MSDLDNPAFKKLYSLGVVNNNIENQFEEDLLINGLRIKRSEVYSLFEKSYHAIGNILDISDEPICIADFVEKIEQLTFYRKYNKDGILKYVNIIIFKECLIPPLKQFVSDKLLQAVLNDKELYFKINKNIHIWGILGAIEITERDDIKILVNVTELQDKEGGIFNVLSKGKKDKIESFHLPAIHNDEWGFSERIKRWSKHIIDNVSE